MITPIITSLSREVFKTVPMGDRHAAYAMGATRWEMIKEAVIPRSRAGVMGACMLGLGRALGETIVVAMMSGSATRINASFLKPGSSIAGLIANNWGEAGPDMIKALVGMGVVLFVITIIVNMAARAMVWRFARA
jgi:phosphate transport system permease protein